MSRQTPEQHQDPESQSDPSVTSNPADASSKHAPPSSEDSAAAVDSSSEATGATGASSAPTTDSSIFDNPPQSPLPEGYYTADGTPTFDAVRDRIEQRIATADGRGILDEDLPQERDFRQEQEDLKRAGEERLKQLRRSMGLDK